MLHHSKYAPNYYLLQAENVLIRCQEWSGGFLCPAHLGTWFILSLDARRHKDSGVGGSGSPCGCSQYPMWKVNVPFVEVKKCSSSLDL